MSEIFSVDRERQIRQRCQTSDQVTVIEFHIT